MRIAYLRAIALVIAALLPIGSAFAQHNFNRTLTVDKSGSADFTTIQGAIDAATQDGKKYTILIFSDTYAENITLDGFDENIDLVGIDRESVIIAPASGNGIVITSGTETSRNNRITNLTIITTDGHGIKIVKGTAVPKDITIEGVTIRAGGDGMNGIDGAVATDVRVFDCDIETEAVSMAGAGGHGMDIGDRWTIQNVTVNAQADATSESYAAGIRMSGVDGVTIQNSQISSKHTNGLWIVADSQNVTVRSCEINGGAVGVRILLGDHILFESCRIVGPTALWFDRLGVPPAAEPADIAAVGCRIQAIATGAGVAAGVVSDTESLPRVVNCDISAASENGPAYGVYVTRGVSTDMGLVVIGGSVITNSEDEKQTEVFDLFKTSGGGKILMSGTRMSKWSGPIQSAERPRAVIQRTINIDASTSTAIHDAIALIAMDEQPITADITNPDVYRVLRVLGNETDMDQDVYIIGTDWADNVITEKIKLTGTTPAKGVKPFKTVTKIIVPAWKDPGETVSIGTTSKIGLYFPIASTSDVLQQGLKASSANSYRLEFVSTPDATYATIDLGLGLTDNDSYEWAILVSH